MASSTRNIIIVILIVLAIGGVTYVRMSTLDRDAASNLQDQETTDETTTPEETSEPTETEEETEPPTEPEPEPEEPEPVEPEPEETTWTPEPEW